MEQNLDIKTKLLSFNGIIGRRDYLVNMVILCFINIVFTLPYTYWIMTHLTSLDTFNVTNTFMSVPMPIKIWFLTGTSFTLVISLSNMFRRLNDICGRVSNTVNISCAIICVLASYGFLFVPILAYIGLFLSFILFIILACIPGRITGKMPYDVTKVFNWGAFLGTWIWGLFNKCYIPLWHLLLWLTPIGIYFQIYCGLKGNEWAYKNNNCTDVEAFNESQKKQTTIWAIISIIIIPVLYFLFIILLIIGIAGFVANDAKVNGPEKTISRFETFIDSQQALYFKTHVITENENKYYIEPSDWASYTFSAKKDILDLAAASAGLERAKKFPNQGTHHSKTDELVRTKIYSTVNGELLGEFVIDTDFSKVSNAKEAFKEGFKAALKAYRFYQPTEK